jgi:uncharacterized protein (TIGR02996 family)
MTELDFLEAIDDDPGGLDTYLVYADWLEEQGQTARAQLIRAEVEQEQSPADNWQAYKKRVEALRAWCVAAWPAYQQWEKAFGFYWELGLPSTILPSGKKVPDHVLNALPEFPWLTRINSNKAPKADLVVRLAERSRLHTFAFAYGTVAARFGDAGLRDLAPMISWKGLELIEAGVKDAGLAHLAPLRQLRVLNLSSNAITDAGLAHLSGLRQLRDLDLSYTKVTAACLDLIGQCKQMRRLRLSQIESIDDSNVARLSTLRHLRELDIARTRVTRYRLLRLLRCPKLKRLRLEASMAIEDEEGEMREVEAFLAEAEEADLLVDMDWE